MNDTKNNNGNSGSDNQPVGTITPAVDPGSQVSGTMAPLSVTMMPLAGTMTPPIDASGDSVPFPDYPTYEIKGTIYQVVSLVSSNSGEANVYCVENKNKKYALKLYHLYRHPDHAILDIIKKVSDQFGDKSLLVRIFDHGIWHDNNTGIDYDYELMEYCSGGSLASLILGKTKDEEQFKKIAMQMACAIDFCHNNANLLHRDIKPANFLFTDETRQRLVLTDFGIAKIMDENHEVPNKDTGRTVVYVAPEIYTRMDNVETTIGMPSDYYSLGMSLLALWIGEGVLTAEERSLINKKQEEALPYPSNKEMSDHSLSLIKKLTRAAPGKRATFEDITKWRKGEVLFIENNFMIDNNFKPITFQRDKNIIATSPQHLARLMWENQELGIRYLYNDQVQKWFDNMDWNEISVSINEIIEDHYPHDRNAGLYACCLLLDKDLPLLMDMDADYEGGKRPLKSASDIARELYYNDNQYINEKKIQQPSHLLWVYLSQRLGMSEDEIKVHQNKIEKYGVRQLRRLCYVLDNQLPFRVNVNGQNVEYNDFEDVFHALHKGVFNQSNITLLNNTDFTTWVRMRDPMRYDRAMVAIGDLPPTASSEDVAWTIVYSIGWEYGYDFLPAIGDNNNQNKSRLVTIEDAATAIAQEINSGKGGQGTLSSQVDGQNFVNSRLFHYLHLRGKYDKYLELWTTFTDMQDPDNLVRYGSYNRTIGLMKAVAATIGYVPFEVGKLTVKSLDEYQDNKQQVNERLRQDKELQQRFVNWLALQFQENPRADIGNGNYRKLTDMYHNFLLEHAPQSEPAMRSRAAEQKIDSGKHVFSMAKGKVKLIRTLVTLLCFVPLTIICVSAIAGLFFVDSSIFKDVMLKLGEVIGGICAIITFFYVLSDEFNVIGGLIIGAIVFFLVRWLCSILTPIVPWVLVGALILVMIYFGKGIFKGKEFMLYDNWNDGRSLSIGEAENRARLAAAFDSHDKLLGNLPKDYPACVYFNSAHEIRSSIKPLIIKSLVMLLLTALVIVGLSWGYYKAKGFDDHSTTSITQYESHPESYVMPDLTGHYTGTFHERNSTLDLKMKKNGDEIDLTGTVTIYYSTTMVQKVVGTVKDGMIILNVKKNGKVNERITYNAQFMTDEDDRVRITGHYTNLVQNTNHDFDYTMAD